MPVSALGLRRQGTPKDPIGRWRRDASRRRRVLLAGRSHWDGGGRDRIPRSLSAGQAPILYRHGASQLRGAGVEAGSTAQTPSPLRTRSGIVQTVAEKQHTIKKRLPGVQPGRRWFSTYIQKMCGRGRPSERASPTYFSRSEPALRETNRWSSLQKRPHRPLGAFRDDCGSPRD